MIIYPFSVAGANPLDSCLSFVHVSYKPCRNKKITSRWELAHIREVIFLFLYGDSIANKFASDRASERCEVAWLIITFSPTRYKPLVSAHLYPSPPASSLPFSPYPYPDNVSYAPPAEALSTVPAPFSLTPPRRHLQ